ncbi:mannose-P-dolichol utilization defect 1 protein [Hymenopellis radicata]|nr:mannose-P-dolichol utilization defect 1 protein [Hymenopellis radicata]
MTTFTQNLPPVVRDLGISVVGEQCYTSLVENLNFEDIECIKYSISKGLGLAIVVGGSIVKVPQLLLILKARSARGLSLPAYIMETLSYAITLAYSFRNEFPFSTYGENFFLAIQNALITLLITFFSPNATGKITLVSAALTGAVSTLYNLPKDTLAVLQFATLPLSLFSKLPQIASNYQAGSTGQLSAFAVISQVLGCAARLFTTSQEVGDPVVLTGFALALLLNLVLGAQLWMYWGKTEAQAKVPVPVIVEEPVKEKEKVQAYEPKPSSRPHTPSGSRPGTPTPGARKWARKLD